MAQQDSTQRSKSMTSSRAKISRPKKVMVVRVKKPVKVQQRVQSGMSPFAGVSEVDSAPIAIGNTLRSVKPIVKQTKGGTIVVGRDFVMPMGGIASAVTTWCLCGGTPLTPAALVASALRGFFSSYERYRVIRLQLHYITSSPTSLPGDVLLLYHENRGGPKVNHNSANFLSYALSSANAVLGPQWSNKSVNISVGSDWKLTDFFNSEDLQHQSDGEILLYGRATSNGISPDSPGYLVIDYEVEFQHLMVNPRIVTLPTGLIKWFNVGLRTGIISPTSGDKVEFHAFSADNNTELTSTSPGDGGGYVFQVVLDLDASLYNPNGMVLSSMWSTKLDDGGGLNAFALTTGTTIYGVSYGLPAMNLYPTYPAALSGRPFVWTTTSSNINIGMNMSLSLCGNVSSAYTQASIG